ncbi:hypothetical protein BESB_062340 [Besnoitia besnoiti]|uniref:Uncharacterized protein n=1 Tax=Besnoitia besnoiti TaxID=94643 RepID=A0A2A9MID6_BESBE|nr:hypothetical protein BESB_062340 [Besnoitia besnoiti]PFH35347.1 hypothetical protein BESB_062340 [Besnoitia besnoiti]
MATRVTNVVSFPLCFAAHSPRLQVTSLRWAHCAGLAQALRSQAHASSAPAGASSAVPVAAVLRAGSRQRSRAVSSTSALLSSRGPRCLSCLVSPCLASCATRSPGCMRSSCSPLVTCLSSSSSATSSATSSASSPTRANQYSFFSQRNLKKHASCYSAAPDGNTGGHSGAAAPVSANRETQRKRREAKELCDAVPFSSNCAVAPSFRSLSFSCSVVASPRALSRCTYTREFSTESETEKNKYGPDAPHPPPGLRWSWWELYVKGVNPEYPPRQRMYAFLTAQGVDVLEMEIREIEDATRWLEMRNVYGEKFPRFPYDVTLDDKVQELREKYPLVDKRDE